jgi:hypothetical protein
MPFLHLESAWVQAAKLLAARLQGCRAASCRGEGCKGCATGCRAAVQAAMVALQVARWTWAVCAKRGGNALVHFEIQNSSRFSRASPSKERNPDTPAKPTPKSGPSVVNNTRIACWGEEWEGSLPGMGGAGGEGGGVAPPRPHQPQPKGSRLKATPTCRGSADFDYESACLPGATDPGSSTTGDISSHTSTN